MAKKNIKPRKKSPIPPPPEPQAKPQAREFDVEAIGKLARIKQYKQILSKIQQGRATASDMKVFERLEEQIKTEDDQQDSNLYNRQQAVDYLQISARTFKWHVNRGKISQRPDGYFDRRVLDQWKENRRNPRNKTDSQADQEKPYDGPLSERIDQADLRYKLARAEREEYVTMQLKGNLVERQAVEAALLELITTTKKAFLLLPYLAPTILQGKDQAGQVEVISKAVDEILTGLEQQSDTETVIRRVMDGK